MKRTSVVAVNKGRKPFPAAVKTLGDLLKIRRGGRLLKQRDLAALLQIDRSIVSGWERDEAMPTTEEWAKVAEILSLPATPAEAVPNSGP